MPVAVPDASERLVAHLFRHEAGRLQAVLARWLGLHRLDEAEDLVQDTLLQALTVWKVRGVPEQPAAWLYAVAQRKTLDLLRREQRYRRLAGQLAPAPETTPDPPASALFLAEEITDSQLRMLFACCHPALAPEAQLALCLKILGGLSAAELAGAFLVPADTMTKRLYRAKERLRAVAGPLEVPSGAPLTGRLAAVLKSLYLLFNEGYNSAHPDQLIRRELCEEALRLALLLTQHPRTNRPETHALLALLCFQTSRFAARTDADGAIVLLADQDRRRWHQPLIAQGLRHLGAAAAGEAAGEFHLEAAIALEHCRAPTYAATDWPAIGRYYDQLLLLKPTPVVALHRAVALAQAVGPAPALAAVLALAGLDQHHLYHAVLGELYAQTGQPAPAARHLDRALALTASRPEQDLLRRKRAALPGAPGPDDDELPQ
ncbi:sigma-70 family RNA polymerase sigma factor [Hymenobacter sp.]|uniref:RNA polymerase sigma factor n=1 Tax=Hymenobacter sp. TaxID=1898978 RepID=UPI00286CAAB0|nr:sigma-70 family RNA polymerase sigma factor [Hymenobacter sp.]